MPARVSFRDLPRFLPLQRFCSRGERPVMSSAVPTVLARVTSMEFRTPSTFCSPRDLSGLFHPDPARGVSPFEAIFRSAPYGPLDPPRPSGFPPRPFGSGPPLQGLARRAESAARIRLFTGVPNP
jgi:hypothetical protein